ncbi:IS21-like element helper ATPase IstB [Clostridium grantii]|uniref:DNA replication protein DnaC n=1 Tax=Clostridium grantii DSM 8605 TaxID=1121316 RepID=A0A1M5Y3C9_9CLOT|nr:IS21-like element helper ATPase IstB [Clostridium grantii]SHI06512.1 DNA replication protein DnaC [Clostridium grantii DSM 8605]
MSSKNSLIKEIKTYAESMKLGVIKSDIELTIEDANANNLSYEEFLHGLLQKESDIRSYNLTQSRIRTARFPYKKYLEDISIEDLPSDAQLKLKHLSSLKFIKDGQNVIFSGNCGTGKTHISIALGIKACLEGYKVLFTTVPLFITQLKELKSNKSLRGYQNKLSKYDLVILDEFGYISADKEGAELLFTHISLRTGQKSTIITTNLSFDRWGEIFGDPVMTAAMTDRLTHKSYVVNMNGNSYRMKETKDWLNNLEN